VAYTIRTPALSDRRPGVPESRSKGSRGLPRQYNYRTRNRFPSSWAGVLMDLRDGHGAHMSSPHQSAKQQEGIANKK